MLPRGSPDNVVKQSESVDCHPDQTQHNYTNEAESSTCPLIECTDHNQLIARRPPCFQYEGTLRITKSSMEHSATKNGTHDWKSLGKLNSQYY